MNKLFVLWKTDNLIDIEQMVIPYIHHSKKMGWWDEIEVMIWGASQKVVANNFSIKVDIEAMKHDGIKFNACKSCSDNLCVSNELSALGVDVVYTGEILTDRLQSDEYKVITF
ncbi:hypothetical protein [Haloplasma contractile]|uniref:DsrE/DsrF-like domain containing protein n=1 Tax=Haloplasma contractile SSD-17B TaxID=1033810 RepID=U2FJV2_9MOLU|nr:hypothetical protein [Haloplasma contractile]ERJ11509.1 DsrE/DsrF-like domain containing protein [Haloplasma contractile SSD-17B]